MNDSTKPQGTPQPYNPGPPQAPAAPANPATPSISQTPAPAAPAPNTLEPAIPQAPTAPAPITPTPPQSLTAQTPQAPNTTLPAATTAPPPKGAGSKKKIIAILAITTCAALAAVAAYLFLVPSGPGLSSTTSNDATVYYPEGWSTDDESEEDGVYRLVISSPSSIDGADDRDGAISIADKDSDLVVFESLEDLQDSFEQFSEFSDSLRDTVNPESAVVERQVRSEITTIDGKEAFVSITEIDNRDGDADKDQRLESYSVDLGDDWLSILFEYHQDEAEEFDELAEAIIKKYD